MYCMQCGAWNDDTARFCIKCGAQLISVEAPRPARRRPPPVQPAPARHRTRRRWLIAFVAALALVLLLAGGTFAVYRWVLRGWANDAAKLVPANADLYLSLSPSPQQLLQIRKLQKLEALAGILALVPGVGGTVEGAGADLFEELEIDFQADVQPWLGLEIGLALLDLERTLSYEEPGIILAVATRSQAKSDAFLQKLREQAEAEGSAFAEENYRGVQVVYKVPQYDWETPLAYATFNRFVVLTTGQETMHRAIDTAKGDVKALAKDKDYKTIMGELSRNRVGYVYLDWKDFPTVVAEEVPLPAIAQIEGLRGLGAALRFTSDGACFDYVLAYDLKRLTPTQRQIIQRPANPNKALQAVPSEAILYTSGQDLYAAWHQFREMMEAEDSDFRRSLDELRYELGFDLEDDLLAWMTGEYALAFLYDRTGFLSDEDLPFGLLLLIEVKDRGLVERKMETIAEALVEEVFWGYKTFEKRRIGGVEMQIIETNDGTIGYGFVGDFLVIGTSERMLAAAVDAGDAPLSADPVFRQAIAPLPSKNNGYFYLDVEQGMYVLYRTMSDWEKEDFDENARPYLEPIKAIAAAVQQPSKEGMVSGTLFICLKAEE